MTKLTIILPTLNEKENIENLIPVIEDTVPVKDFEIIIADGGSKDGTVDAAENLDQKYGNIRVLKNTGDLGSSVLKGIKASKGQYIIVMDADFQHPPELIPKILEKLESGHDFVIASKYLEKESLRDWKFHRKIISRGASIIFKILFPSYYYVTDPMSGYFGFNRDILKGNMDKLSPRGYKIMLELLVICNPKNIVEISYKFGQRKYGHSKLGIRNIINYLIHVLDLKKRSLH